MGALLGGMQSQQGGGQTMGQPPQAVGGTGYAGTSALGTGGQQAPGNGLLTLLAPLLIQSMSQAQQPGSQGGGLLSMLLGGQLGGGSPQAQGAQGDVAGTRASMNPGNYMQQTNSQAPAP